MDDITEKIAQCCQCWNKRLENQIEKAGYTSQEAFAKEFKKKYGTGTQTNVSRWIHVGNEASGGKKCIGFPTYESMIKVASLLDVSVGYLAGETDFKTYEMERTCNYLGIDEETGCAIQSITKSKEAIHRYQNNERTAALKWLLTAKNFGTFITGLYNLIAAIEYKKHIQNHFEEAYKKISPDLQELALACFEGDRDSIANATPEIREAAGFLEDAIDMDYAQSEELEKEVKMAKYELHEIYVKLLEELETNA